MSNFNSVQFSSGISSDNSFQFSSPKILQWLPQLSMSIPASEVVFIVYREYVRLLLPRPPGEMSINSRRFHAVDVFRKISSDFDTSQKSDIFLVRSFNINKIDTYWYVPFNINYNINIFMQTSIKIHFNLLLFSYFKSDLTPFFVLL